MSSPMTGHVALERLPVSHTRAACASWIEVRVMTNWMTLPRRAAMPMPTSTMRWPARGGPPAHGIHEQAHGEGAGERRPRAARCPGRRGR